MGFYVLCPYYQNHKLGTACITCEDTKRFYFTDEKRDEQVREVCSTDKWEECPHAKRLNELYERIEDMNLTEKEKANLKLTCESQKSELKKLRSALRKNEKLLKAEVYRADTNKRASDTLQTQLEIAQGRVSALTYLAGWLSDQAEVEGFRLEEIKEYGNKYFVAAMKVGEDPETDYYQIIKKERKPDGED